MFINYDKIIDEIKGEFFDGKELSNFIINSLIMKVKSEDNEELVEKIESIESMIEDEIVDMYDDIWYKYEEEISDIIYKIEEEINDEDEERYEEGEEEY